MALGLLLSLMQTFECHPIFKLSPFILPPLPSVNKIHLILHAYALLRRERRKPFSFNSPKWIAIFPKPSRYVEWQRHEKRQTNFLIKHIDFVVAYLLSFSFLLGIAPRLQFTTAVNTLRTAFGRLVRCSNPLVQRRISDAVWCQWENRTNSRFSIDSCISR